MNYKKLLSIFVFSSFVLLADSEQDQQPLTSGSGEIHVSVQAKKTKKVSLGIIITGAEDASLTKCVNRLKQDMEWSGQCIVAIERTTQMKHVKDLSGLFQSKVTIALIISKSSSSYTWRLYDTSCAQMITGKKLDESGLTSIMVAHTIADELWPQLFGQQSSFRSKIAYAKQIWRMKYGKEKPYKQIWIADFDGSNPKLFIDAPTISFAPRWSNDPSCPLLFYSENTLSNVQLVMSNMFGKRKVICSFDGLNMQPTFGEDGKKVVFCLSKDGSSQLYLSYIDTVSKQRNFDRLTFNSGNNLAPCFVDNSHVAFVSDFKTSKPQLFMLDLKTKIVTRITDGGYCACPSYSSVRKQIVYSKMIGSGMQLFSYDLKTSEHKQLTNGFGSKEEGTWSPCGNYIVYGLNEGCKSRIAQLHLPTGTIKYLTSEKDHCTYPDCSPIYQDCIGVLGA